MKRYAKLNSAHRLFPLPEIINTKSLKNFLKWNETRARCTAILARGGICANLLPPFSNPGVAAVHDKFGRGQRSGPFIDLHQGISNEGSYVSGWIAIFHALCSPPVDFPSLVTPLANSVICVKRLIANCSPKHRKLFLGIVHAIKNLVLLETQN